MLVLAVLRRRWAGFVGAFVALALGVALIAATLLVYASAQPHVPERYAGASVLVRGAQAGADEEQFPDYRPWSAAAAAALAARLAAIPGVTAAVPDRSFYAQVVRDGRPIGRTDAGDPQGRPWSAASLAPYRLAAGRAPAAGEIAVGAGLGVAAGSRVGLLTAAGPVEVTVSGVVDGPGIYLPDGEAARQAPGVQVIALRTAPGASPAAVATAARGLAGPATVHIGEDRRALEPEHEARIRYIGVQLLTVMAGLSLFAAVFVVASTSALAVYQRRRDFGLLRAVGATPGQVRRMVFGESLAVGAVAAVAGAALGVAIARPFGRLLVVAGFEPEGFAIRVTPAPILAAAALGTVVSLCGVWSASRRAGRVSPLAALRTAVVERRPMTAARWVFGGLALAAGLALVAGTAAARGQILMNLALCAAFSLLAAAGLLAPAIVPPIVRLLTWPLGRLPGATGMLVRENSVASVRRTAATMAPVLVSVGFAVLITGLVGTLSAAVAVDAARDVRAAAVAIPDGTPGLSDAAVAAVPGVSALPTTLLLGGGSLAAVGADAASQSYVGIREPLAAGELAVAAGVARDRGWRPGTAVPVTYADGEAGSLRVARVFDAGADLPAPVLLDRATVRAHDPSALTERIYASGAVAAPAGLGVKVLDVAAYGGVADAEEDRLVHIFELVLVGMAAGYTVLAVANTLMMATAERRGEFAVLRLAGASRRQILRAVAAESTVVVVIGSLLGLAVALAALLGVRRGLAEDLGLPVGLEVPLSTNGAVVAACLAFALAASVLPARMALRRS